MRVWTCLKLIALGLILIAVGVGTKLAVSTVALVRRQTSPEQLHAMLYEELTAALDAEVELGPVRLNPEGFLCAEGLTVRLPGDEEPLLECRQVFIGLDKVQALFLRPVVEKLIVVEPKLRLSYSKGEQGWNIERLRFKPRPEAEPPEGLLRGGITLEGAAVTVSDALLFGDDAPRTYEGLNVVLRPGRGTGDWRVDGALTRGPLAGTQLSGWFRTGKDGGLSLDVAAGRLEAGEALWGLVPAGRRVWDDYRVQGLLACRGTVRQAPGEPLHFNFDVDVSGASLRTPYFPLPLDRVSGRIRITDREVVLQDCRAVVLPAALGDPEGKLTAQVVASGSVPMDGRGLALRIEALDLPLCRAVVESIPGAGPQIWERLKPEGRARLLLTVRDEPSTPDLDFTAVVELDDATISPKESPVPIQNLGGTLVVDGQTVRLRDVRGLIVQEAAQGTPGPTLAAVSIDGVLDLGGRNSLLNVSLSNLRTNEQLVRAVPGVGDDLWETLKPEVLLDAQVRLIDGADGGTMAPSVRLVLHGGRAEPSFLPMPLEDLAGTVRAEGDKVFLERLSATIVPEDGTAGPGHAPSLVELQGTVVPKGPVLDLYLKAENLVLTERILSVVPVMGPQLWQQTRLQGWASVAGQVRYDGREDGKLALRLSVNLQDVSLLPQALPIRIDALAGELLVTEQQALSNDFTGVTCRGKFRGAAIVDYAEAADLLQYNAQIQFSQVDLGLLIERLSGERRKVDGRLSGELAIGGLAGDALSTAGEGHVELSEGRLWETPFFAKLLGVLSLVVPSGDEVPAKGDANFTISGNLVSVQQFELAGGGLALSGVGKVTLDRGPDLTMMVVGAPAGGGIPIVTPIVSWLLQFVERQLFEVRVSGTWAEPEFDFKVLGKITRPLTGLGKTLISPLVGGGSDRGKGSRAPEARE